jgi:uncharacterized surface protein with fasciclin (FAS1) repeats
MFARLTRVGGVVAVALATSIAAAPAASASTHPAAGTSSLAALLAKDGSGFDRNGGDFDITDNAIRTVLQAKPQSAVGVLADGTVALTAFLPNDRAFERLATDLTGRHYASESRTLGVLAGKLGVDTIESVLLYHVVPGSTITYAQARRSNGAVLATALSGATVKVRVSCRYVTLVDADPDDRNPTVVKRNLNQGNRQIAHGINRVLRPVNL